MPCHSVFLRRFEAQRVSLAGWLLTALLVALPGCGGGGESASSAAPESGSPAAAPSAFELTLLTAGNAEVQVAWSGSAGASGYRISLGRQADSLSPLALSGPASPATLTGLNNGFAHYLAVTAFNAQGETRAVADGPVFPMYAPAFKYTCLRNFYVSTTGSDANDGRTLERAYASIDVAVNGDVRAGDCINVAPGLYTQFVSLGKGGSNDSSTGYVVLRSMVPLGARLRPPAGAYSTIDLNASYLVVDGFDVVGGAGSAIDGCVNAAGVHHLVALNNHAHDSGQSGIAMCSGEYFRIEGNVTANNAASSIFQGSGISLYQARAIAPDDGSDFHNVVRNNVSYGNAVRYACDRCHTDGNGIIVDDFQNTQMGSGPWAGVAYPHATLLENNLVFGNGGGGVQVYLSNRITVRHNTAYANNQDRNFALGAIRGELSNAGSDDNTWVNNIGHANPSLNGENRAIVDAAASVPNRNVVWRNNLAWAGSAGTDPVTLDNSTTPVTAALGNLLGIDPRFIAASTDPALADFRLRSDSPGIGSGLSTSNRDTLNGVLRSVTSPDRGAY